MIKLSKPNKMPCKTWSLQAQETCPGSFNPDGTLVQACKGCYASEGMYVMPNTRALRAHNLQDWRRPEWESDMVKALTPMPHFRWFDSGDLFHPRLALKVFGVMLRTPNTQHWLPTRTHKIPRIRKILTYMARLANVCVRYSSDSIDGDVDALPEAINDDNQASVIDHVSRIDMRRKGVCKAFQRDGECGPCRKCWDKTIPVITYPQHGRKMAKQERVA